jgi:DNA (cytosine-5)-methyltransferase 1
MTPIIVDNFAGGGGASLGIERAIGRPINYAINHDPEAIAMHTANHPRTVHLQTNLQKVDPRTIGTGLPIGLAWFSPDCTYHSKARGARPFRDRDVARRRRGLAWTVPHWMKLRRPTVVMLENVEEFADWGPLLPDGKPCPARRGLTFRRWHRQIENLGYRVDMRELRACDYGAPTTRKRLFVIARCDGGEIVFPEETHGRSLLPYRSAAECIDWSIPCHSIFSRERPLADATLRRIARGVMRFVVNSPKPFIVRFRGSPEGGALDIEKPMPTITAGSYIKRPGGAAHALGICVPTLINTRNGERPGQAPRIRDILEPYATITAEGSQGALVAAFLARHYGGHENDGSELDQLMHTITAKDHHSLVASHLVKLKGTCRDGQPLDEPLHTIQASGQHYGEVRTFLAKHGAKGSPIVSIHGEQFAIVDIGMRMLSPRELYRAQSFPDSYIIDPEFEGKPLTKTAQVRMCGNSVPPIMAEVLVRANLSEQEEQRAA